MKKPFTWDGIHPIAVEQFKDLAAFLETQYGHMDVDDYFRPFEGHRTIERQEELYRNGTTRAHGWYSAHQYGLAVDFVPFKDGGWSWDDSHNWRYLKYAAAQFGLEVPIEWDRCHVQHPAWTKLRTVLKI